MPDPFSVNLLTSMYREILIVGSTRLLFTCSYDIPYYLITLLIKKGEQVTRSFLITETTTRTDTCEPSVSSTVERVVRRETLGSIKS